MAATHRGMIPVSAVGAGNVAPTLSKTFWAKLWLDLEKFGWIWAKSKSCIHKNIRSPTAMLPVRLFLQILQRKTFHYFY